MTDQPPAALLRALGGLMPHYPTCPNKTDRQQDCTCREGARP